MKNSIIIIASLIVSTFFFTSCSEDALMTNTIDLPEVNVSAAEMDMNESNLRTIENREEEGTTTIPSNCEVQLRTQTQGGWGSAPRGNNPGAYLHANFDRAFPNGLTIGSTHKITFTSAQAITDFLPAGGTASTIESSYKNPTQDLPVVVGQLVAASLSAAFDVKDETFGISRENLSNMKVAAGAFKGWTVKTILKESNAVLSGASTRYSVGEINEVLTGINENYVDGTMDNGFFSCAEATTASTGTETETGMDTDHSDESQVFEMP